MLSGRGLEQRLKEKVLKKGKLYIAFTKMEDHYYYFTLNKKGNITERLAGLSKVFMRAGVKL